MLPNSNLIKKAGAMEVRLRQPSSEPLACSPGGLSTWESMQAVGTSAGKSDLGDCLVEPPTGQRNLSYETQPGIRTPGPGTHLFQECFMGDFK